MSPLGYLRFLKYPRAVRNLRHHRVRWCLLHCLTHLPQLTHHLLVFRAAAWSCSRQKIVPSNYPLFSKFCQLLVICAAWSWWRQKCVPWNYQFFPPPIATDLSPWIQTKVPLSTSLLPSSQNAIHEKNIVRDHKVAKKIFSTIILYSSSKNTKMPPWHCISGKKISTKCIYLRLLFGAASMIRACAGNPHWIYRADAWGQKVAMVRTNWQGPPTNEKS